MDSDYTKIVLAALLIGRALLKYANSSCDGAYDDAVSRLRLVIEDVNAGNFDPDREFWLAVRDSLSQEQQAAIAKILAVYS